MTYNKPIKYFGSVIGVMFSNGTQEFALIPIKIVHEIIGRFSTSLLLANRDMLVYKLLSFLYIYTSDNSGAKSAPNLVREIDRRNTGS